MVVFLSWVHAIESNSGNQDIIWDWCVWALKVCVLIWRSLFLFQHLHSFEPLKYYLLYSRNKPRTEIENVLHHWQDPNKYQFEKVEKNKAKRKSTNWRSSPSPKKSANKKIKNKKKNISKTPLTTSQNDNGKFSGIQQRQCEFNVIQCMLCAHLDCTGTATLYMRFLCIFIAILLPVPFLIYCSLFILWNFRYVVFGSFDF